jgi:hypothetical protein
VQHSIELVHTIVTEAPFQQHAAWLTTQTKEQAAVVALLLRHCLPRLTAGGPQTAATSATAAAGDAAASLETTMGCLATLGAAVQAGSLRSGLQAELARPGGALITARQLQLALVALPPQPPQGAPAALWRDTHVKLLQLLSDICELVKQHHSCAAATDAATASISLVRSVAWEAMAAVPAVAAALSSTVAASHCGGGESGAADVAAVEQHCAAMGEMLLNAAPLDASGATLPVSSPKQLAVWAAAADAGLRLLPALLAQGDDCGVAHTALVQVLGERLLLDGSAEAYQWVMAACPDGIITGPGGSTACTAWAAAAPSLAALHARLCRWVHWLRAQPDRGASLLTQLLPRQADDEHWITLLYHLCQQYNLCLLAFSAVPSERVNGRCASLLTSVG